MTRRFAVLLFLLLGLLASCGKQQWPEPLKAEDRFSIRTVKADRSGGCLAVEVALSGNADNLTALSVQFMEIGEGDGMGCPGCPFRPSRAVTFTPGQDGLVRQGDVFRFSACGLDPQGVYLWRVSAANRFASLGLVESGLFSSWPK